MSKKGVLCFFFFFAVSQLTKAGLNNKSEQKKKGHKVMLVLPHQFSHIWRYIYKNQNHFRPDVQTQQMP